jgi:hypothetical protein
MEESDRTKILRDKTIYYNINSSLPPTNINSVFSKIVRQAHTTTLAGGGSVGGILSGYRDGPGVNSLFKNPIGLSIDSYGNIYVADFLNNLIRKMIISDDTVDFVSSIVTNSSINNFPDYETRLNYFTGKYNVGTSCTALSFQ